jgi:hypothetical protein
MQRSSPKPNPCPTFMFDTPPRRHCLVNESLFSTSTHLELVKPNLPAIPADFFTLIVSQARYRFSNPRRKDSDQLYDLADSVSRSMPLPPLLPGRLAQIRFANICSFPAENCWMLQTGSFFTVTVAGKIVSRATVLAAPVGGRSHNDHVPLEIWPEMLHAGMLRLRQR